MTNFEHVQHISSAVVTKLAIVEVYKGGSEDIVISGWALKHQIGNFV